MLSRPPLTVRRYPSLYWYFLLQRFKILMEYRANFFIGAASTVAMQAAGVLTVWVVMAQIPNLKGWSLNEVLLVYGLITLARSVNHMFADNLWTVGHNYIRSGGFDRFLVRPLDPLFHLLADRFCHDGVGDFLVGATLVTVALQGLHLPFTAALAANLIIGTFCGGLIFAALNLITATTAFWIVESVPVTRSVFELNEFAKYPLSIYPKAITLLLTWVVPFGFASYYPAAAISGRLTGTPAWLAVPVSLLLAFIAYRVWCFGLRHYTGSGS
ncbi:MAG TPA: ABC-2 family transporter protein [Deinococcales bacterium]|nr:ABC-2 family transporter protein [Deinococcales bacterium]